MADTVTNCPNCGWQLDQALSRLDIAAVETSMAEGDSETGAGEAGTDTVPGRVVAFTVSRTGPLDQECSVEGKWTGTVDLDDFVEGTKDQGRLSWPAGEGGERRLSMVIEPDKDFEADETITVVLFNPMGCTLGTAEASVTIVNDDAEPEPEPEPEPRPPTTVPGKGYDEALPLGGLGLGTPCLLGQPGNQKVYSESSLMIRCERSGTVEAISWQNRINGHGRTGYSDGDGGTIHWTCRVVPDPNAATIKPGPVLGITRKIKAAAKPAGWLGEYQAAGGKGSVPLIFVEIPTLRFIKPFKVRCHDMLLFTQYQTGSGAVSINNNYSTCRSFSDWSPYAYHKSCRQFRGASMSVRRTEHFPLILIGYDDGVVKGTGVMGYSAGLTQAQESIELMGRTRARQVFVCPDWADGMTVRRVVSFWGRTTTAVNGSLRCRIRLAQDGGGLADEGQALADSVLLANQVAYRPDIKNGKPAPLVRHEFDNPAKLVAGKTYYVVMECVGGSTCYRGSRCVRWLDYPPVGLKNPDWALKGMEGQRDTGSGWKSLAVSGVKQDIPVWLEF